VRLLRGRPVSPPEAIKIHVSTCINCRSLACCRRAPNVPVRDACTAVGRASSWCCTRRNRCAARRGVNMNEFAANSAPTDPAHSCSEGLTPVPTDRRRRDGAFLASLVRRSRRADPAERGTAPSSSPWSLPRPCAFPSPVLLVELLPVTHSCETAYSHRPSMGEKITWRCSSRGECYGGHVRRWSLPVRAHPQRQHGAERKRR